MAQARVCDIRTRALGAVTALLVLGSATAEAGSIITDTAVSFVEPNAIYGGFSSVTKFPILPPGGNTLSVGGTFSGVGASATGTVSYNLDGYLNPFQLAKFDMIYNSIYKSAVIWTGSTPTVGQSFLLASAATPLGLKSLHLDGSGFGATLGLSTNLFAGLRAEACLGGCLRFKYNLTANLGLDIAGINTLGGGELRLLGQTVGNLPLTASAGNGAVTISGNIPNFSTTMTNVAPGAPITYSSTQPLLAGSVDFAQVLADAIGVPFPLSGNVLGFDYTLLSVVAGLGLNLQHTFGITSLSFETVYRFSSPVQVRDANTGIWSAPMFNVVVPSGDLLEVRSAQPALTLSALPTYRLRAQIDADWNLLPIVTGSIRAGELSGHGLNLGPVINTSHSETLGSINVDATDQDRVYSTTGKPVTLTFDPLTILDGVPFDLCANAACTSTAFSSKTRSLGDGWATDSIVAVTDVTSACLRRGDCPVDPTFAPIEIDYLLDPDLEAPLFAPDRDSYLGVLATPPRSGGPESDAARLREQMRALGVDFDNLGLPRTIGQGAPPLTEPLPADIVVEIDVRVPGPSTLTLALTVTAFWLAVASVRRASRRPGG